MNNQSGISRIEMSLGIAILAILGIMAMTSADHFSTVSKQAEARTLTTIAFQLLETYQKDQGRPPEVSEFADSQKALSGDFMFLSAEDYLSDDSCNVKNPLGFKMRYCKKSFYQYHLMKTVGTQGAPCVEHLCAAATERGYMKSIAHKKDFSKERFVFPGCKDPFADVFAFDVVKGLWNVVKPSC
jgi:type II secretory pathway pseudopilin PulG